MPMDYFELTMCRIYHCTPTMLKGVPVVTMYRHIACIQGEQDYSKPEGLPDAQHD